MKVICPKAGVCLQSTISTVSTITLCRHGIIHEFRESCKKSATCPECQPPKPVTA